MFSSPKQTLKPKSLNPLSEADGRNTNLASQKPSVSTECQIVPGPELGIVGFAVGEEGFWN